MPSSDPVQRFTDIVENINRIGRFTKGMDVTAFAANEQTIHAVKYALVIISEAAAKLGETAVALCPDIPWREVRGLGNRLRHGYDAIDIVRIWLLVERDLPNPEGGLRGRPAQSGEGRFAVTGTVGLPAGPI